MRFVVPAINAMRIIPVFVASIALAGCAAQPGKVVGYCAMPTDRILSRIDLKQMMDEVSAEVCLPAGGIAPDHYRSPHPLLVPDVVDVQSYQPNAFGLAASEIFRESLHRNCRTPIKQVEMARDFSLTPGGLMALSRDSGMLREQSAALPVAMVATYSLAPDRLTVVARAVRITDSVITHMASREVQWRCTPLLTGETDITFTMK
jgi:hypothetical protein